MTSSNTTWPPGEVWKDLIPFGPLANCTLALCPVEWSVFTYQPSIAANSALLAIFGVLLLVHAAQGIKYRAWGYMGCMVAGCVLQIIGYGGRIMLHGNPFDFNAFLMQIICITVAPVFYCAAVYVLLAQMMTTLDPSLSRLSPKLFYYIFIPADVTCLILQATGGALSATGATFDAVNTGVSVSKAGLILQVVVLTIFLGATADYLLVYRRTHGAALLRRLSVFLGAVGAGVVCVLVRCVYRIVELKDGYFGPGFQHQWVFVALEGVVMCIAVVFLAAGHPGMSLYRLKEEKGPARQERQAEVAQQGGVGYH
ncbi:hypothetical protein DPSP01_004638 [Paraphaeosphaeria sporulosa]|uniref:RTA1-domain-containing protein n=1 Tax=Paraphaeosphaeria sporulosa TaxID=1460663 RepID=A0A177C9K0_9PLEO|nr:RTA1-domain-containing protein [Paraphaeosphaeria sporulosa]OAG04056.1 RTA1-domain-containing protein [Paraphaeosphaeria sporulosa]